ncbi:hypothetical protein SO802_014544 [Lithocarpus litseifolius]|uniref:RNase III domain-containing protein n=1 Tax=Lithocarpus litseifolius TaxID=425828 RepID=A0AAW2CTB3_9ROSI
MMDIEASLAKLLEENVLSPRPSDVDWLEWRGLEWRVHLSERENECRKAVEKKKQVYQADCRVPFPPLHSQTPRRQKQKANNDERNGFGSSARYPDTLVHRSLQRPVPPERPEITRRLRPAHPTTRATGSDQMFGRLRVYFLFARSDRVGRGSRTALYLPMPSVSPFLYTIPTATSTSLSSSSPPSTSGVAADERASSIRSVEEILSYRFKDKSLLEEALTHSSYNNGESFKSYQRLEFVGDAVLGLALSNYVFLAYPNLEPGQLSSLRAANISTKKLARVAVRHGLHRFIRHNAPPLHDKV